MQYPEERQKVLDAVREIYEAGLVHGTWGNASARCPGTKSFIITPSGMSYDTLRVEDMVMVDDQGHVVEGSFKPSIETPMHVLLYQSRPEVNAIVHTHSLYVTAFGVAGKSLPVILEETAMVVGHEIPVMEWAVPGSEELARNTIAALGKDKQASFLPHHGLVTVGSSMEEALRKAHVIERTCKIYIYAQILGNVNSISEENISLLKENSKNYGQGK